MYGSLGRACVVSILLFAGMQAATAQSAFRTEVHPIPTQTLSTTEFLNATTEAPKAVVAGELRIPTFGTNRLPAVVLVHGSSGVGANVIDWASELNKLGVAVFILDSFTGRGITSTVADQSLLAHFAMLYDSYRALEILAKHPRIDPDRIAIMGFSKGAVAALYSSMERFQKAYGPAGATFAAHLAFYTPCNTGFIGDTKTNAKPIRFFHGADDDYTPATHCQEYAARLKAAGADVDIFVYPGGHHGFDASVLTVPIRLPNAITGRKCRLNEAPQATIVNTETGKPFTYGDPCIERGATVAHSASAAASARADVATFLKSVFKIQ